MPNLRIIYDRTKLTINKATQTWSKIVFASPIISPLHLSLSARSYIYKIHHGGGLTWWSNMGTEGNEIP